MTKVMVSLPEHLLADIDREVARRGTSRSALLAVAARRELEQQEPAEIDAMLARVRAAAHAAGARNAADLVRAERDR